MKKTNSKYATLGFGIILENNIPEIKLTITGAGINSDHIPVKKMINLKLRNLRNVKVKEQLELELLKQPVERERYNIEVHSRYDVLGNDLGSEQVGEETAENNWAELNLLYQKLSN